MLACPPKTRTKGSRVRNQVAKPKVLKCAIYTRKSSEEGLEQDFNSLHAQRESCEAYIKSQKHEGWVALPVLYDDGGYSGGSIERPALQKLLSDIQDEPGSSRRSASRPSEAASSEKRGRFRRRAVGRAASPSRRAHRWPGRVRLTGR